MQKRDVALSGKPIDNYHKQQMATDKVSDQLLNMVERLAAKEPETGVGGDQTRAKRWVIIRLRWTKTQPWVNANVALFFACHCISQVCSLQTVILVQLWPSVLAAVERIQLSCAIGIADFWFNLLACLLHVRSPEHFSLFLTTINFVVAFSHSSMLS